MEPFINSEKYNALQRVILILCDIDGTLTGTNGRGHSRELLPLLQRLMAPGLRIGLVTGRETLTAKAVHRIFDLNGPIIGENGAQLILNPREDEGSSFVVGGLAKRQKRTIVRRLTERDLLTRFFIDGEKRFLLTLYPREFPRHNPHDLPLLSQSIIEALQSMSAEIEISHSSAAIDISARGVNKGTAIQLLCRMLHVELSAVAFVGDSPNDRSAFEVVGRGGGWLGMVGDDPAVRDDLKAYPYVYCANQTASAGVVEFMEFFLNHRTSGESSPGV